MMGHGVRHEVSVRIPIEPGFGLWYDKSSYPARMPKSKIAITVDSKILGEVDELIARKRFPNRSQAIETALAEKLDRLNHSRLARECAKLLPKEEKAIAEEGLSTDVAEWPEY